MLKMSYILNYLLTYEARRIFGNFLVFIITSDKWKMILKILCLFGFHETSNNKSRARFQTGRRMDICFAHTLKIF